MSNGLEKVSGQSELAPLYAPMDVSDIQLPSAKLVYALSDAAKDGIAKEGDVILGFGNDDREPRFLIGGPDKLTEFRAYILGSDKTAVTTKDGVMEWQDRRDFDDPYSQDVWFFQLALLDWEPEIPVRLMLWKAAGSPAAKLINTMLLRHAQNGNTDPLCVKFTVGERKSKSGPYTYKVWQVSSATPDPDEVEAAKRLQARLHSISRNRRVENDLIGDDQPGF